MVAEKLPTLNGIVKLLGGSRGLGELAGAQRCCGLCGLLDAADVVPRLEGAGPLGAVVGCRHSVAGREEEVVDLIVGGEEPLSVAGRLEPLHLAFSSAGMISFFAAPYEPSLSVIMTHGARP